MSFQDVGGLMRLVPGGTFHPEIPSSEIMTTAQCSFDFDQALPLETAAYSAPTPNAPGTASEPAQPNDSARGPGAAWLDRVITAALGDRRRQILMEADVAAWEELRQAVARAARDKARAARAPMAAQQAETAMFGWMTRLDADEARRLKVLSAARIAMADIPAWDGEVI